ncbi:hypothetical protein UA08_07447 [Talaromyces atroroseus]|uniref:HAUS augmin-like complex subunit 6 N-terminal domain-containing protein n=1 Tax=Talaromyces atroroseus TaxID=1441469 RepID=A0A225AQE5_TALAT|nr:hypothetical protein UA08_07447 [Talaromyces atroroseus]OKL57156.1 hypothetical protein UA08_07447 [Talaromyces atroroseus]
MNTAATDNNQGFGLLTSSSRSLRHQDNDNNRRQFHRQLNSATNARPCGIFNSVSTVTPNHRVINPMQTPRTSPPSTPSWPAPSPVTVFLRNIQLLQLDQRPNWPGLSRKLFSGGQKVQTQRVKSVEWALYHLFLLWDPSEAKNKLRPFFPPLEPLQSVNLRAALFRALSDLKKNGDLGRDTILRKTMLDDCKGAKFEEVLAVFSTAVLQKVVCENNPSELGVRLALARSISENEVEGKLVPLIIAHHAALSAARRDNGRIREGHEQFVKLLDEKAKELAARSSNKLQVTDDFPESERLVRDVKANWLGGQNVADFLFNGGSSVEKDAFLELPFEKAWNHARKGHIEQLRRPSHMDLLEDMERVSSKQRARLQRLRDVKKSLSQAKRGSRTATMTNSQYKDRGLTFRDHQTLTVAGISKSLRETAEPRDLFVEHQAIIDSLRSTLSEVKGIQTEHFSHSPNVEPPPSNRLSPIPDTESFAPSSSPSPSVQVTDYENKHHASGHSPNDPDDLSSVIDGKPVTTLSHPRFEPRPSSLVERTRQSMSLLPPPSSTRSRQSLAARRETRQSQVFPINQFETPPKEVPEPSRSGASTPRDELFTEEAEYASIFKSRPRVAHSPLMSPAVHVGFDVDDDDDADGYVDDSQSVLDLAIAGSPLAMKKR